MSEKVGKFLYKMDINFLIKVQKDLFFLDRLFHVIV